MAGNIPAMIERDDLIPIYTAPNTEVDTAPPDHTRERCPPLTNPQRLLQRPTTIDQSHEQRSRPPHSPQGTGALQGRVRLDTPHHSRWNPPGGRRRSGISKMIRNYSSNYEAIKQVVQQEESNGTELKCIIRDLHREYNTLRSILEHHQSGCTLRHFRAS